MEMIQEEREILLRRCHDRCVEVLGEEDGDIVWQEIYLATARLTVRLDAVAGIFADRRCRTKQDYWIIRAQRNSFC